MLSAFQHLEVVRAYLAKECTLWCMLEPFSLAVAANISRLHINWFRVIPKGHISGKWQLITDLSHLPGVSVNDGIDTNSCSLTYTSVEQVAAVAASYGQGVLLAKVDMEATYRLIPVYPQVVEWVGSIYIDPMLLFGLRSAPKIFTAVADALEWCIHSEGAHHVFHYLDDYIIVT